MTFYKYPLDRSILYITPDGRAYRIGVSMEEYPNKPARKVTGSATKLSNKNKRNYINDALDCDIKGSGKIDKEDVPRSAIKTLERELDESQAP